MSISANYRGGYGKDLNDHYLFVLAKLLLVSGTLLTAMGRWRFTSRVSLPPFVLIVLIGFALCVCSTEVRAPLFW